MSEFVVVYVTTATEKEAELIAKSLLHHKLIACANIFPAVRSLYFWRDSLAQDDEIFLMVKSRRRMLPQIIKNIQALHSYEVPEIIALPIVDGSEFYLQWLRDETGGDDI